jgi:hypothetical protein
LSLEKANRTPQQDKNEELNTMDITFMTEDIGSFSVNVSEGLIEEKSSTTMGRGATTENRGDSTESGELKTEDRNLTTMGEGAATEDRGDSTENREIKTEDRSLTTMGMELKTENNEVKNGDREDENGNGDFAFSIDIPNPFKDEDM